MTPSAVRSSGTVLTLDGFEGVVALAIGLELVSERNCLNKGVAFASYSLLLLQSAFLRTRPDSRVLRASREILDAAEGRLQHLSVLIMPHAASRL